MSESRSEIDQLTAELVATRKEIDREVEHLSTRWGIFSIRVVTPTAIAWIYVAFLAMCLGLGIVFTLHSGTLAGLGIALIVGALFAGGAVVGQAWSFAIQEQHDLFDKAFGEERTKDLENLGKQFWQLKKRRDQLRGELRCSQQR